MDFRIADAPDRNVLIITATQAVIGQRWQQ